MCWTSPAVIATGPDLELIATRERLADCPSDLGPLFSIATKIVHSS